MKEIIFLTNDLIQSLAQIENLNETLMKELLLRLVYLLFSTIGSSNMGHIFWGSIKSIQTRKFVFDVSEDKFHTILSKTDRIFAIGFS